MANEATQVTHYWASQAWVQGRWARDVLLIVGPDGHWSGIAPDTAHAARRGATVLPGPVLPGLVNAHSHAFQRAIAGLTERSAAKDDDFWSWRDRMYSAALRITPAQLEAIASFLYAELLAGGYTQVCEFHYLHNDADGRPYADPLELSMALVRAAQRTGIGLTLLPTLYMRSGFGVPSGSASLREDQRRFASTPQSVLRIAEAVNALQLPRINAGLALHSLRAVDTGALAEAVQGAQGHGWPVHIHIAEQVQEVQDCIAHHGQRPIEWLLNHASVDVHWNLVHATHTTPEELRGLHAANAAIVICPSTEANLGDGVFDLPGWAGLGGNWSIGSDSHVTRSWQEELRLLEYSQRLSMRKRNIAARAFAQESTAAVLFNAALAGGGAATSQALGGIALGQRADFTVIDAQSPALLGVPSDHVLDALVFSSPDARFGEVYVAGQRVALSMQGSELASDFARAMKALWAG